jgi:hypothetical protein
MARRRFRHLTGCRRGHRSPQGFLFSEANWVAYVLVFALLMNFHLGCSGPTGKDDRPELGVKPDTLDFGQMHTSMGLVIDNLGSGVLSWRIQVPSEGWIDVIPDNGAVVNDPVSVEVRIDRERAPEGLQDHSLVVTGSLGGHEVIILRAMVTPPELSVSPDSVFFSSNGGSSILVVENVGMGQLDWSLSVPPEVWLQATPLRGRISSEQAGSVTIIADPSLITEDGTYGASLVFTSNGGEENVTVKMMVEGKIPVPRLHVSPLALNYGFSSSQRNIGLSNAGGGTLEWEAIAQEAWIQITPPSGETVGSPSMIVVEIDRSVLSPGEYSGSIDIVSSGGSVSVPITVSVATPVMALSRREVDFQGGLERLEITITNIGTGDLEWEFGNQLSWLSISPTSGTTNQVESRVSLSVNRVGLEAKDHDGEIELISNSPSEPNSIILVKMHVSPMPVLGVSTDSLDFGPTYLELPLTIANNNNGLLEWEVSMNDPWITLDRKAGENALFVSTSIAVGVVRRGLMPGEYRGNLLITSNGGTQAVGVDFEVRQEPILTVSTQSISFGQEQDKASIEITNSGTGMLTWSTGVESDWLECQPRFGLTLGEADTLELTVDRKGLAPGYYQETLAIDSDGGKRLVAVELQVKVEPVLAISTNKVDFGSEAERSVIEISNLGNAVLAWQAGTLGEWIAIGPQRGQLDVGEKQEIELAVNRNDLEVGKYTASITISSDGGRVTIEVQLVVPKAVLGVSVESLDFGPYISEEQIILHNSGNIPLIWEIEGVATWFDAFPREGTIDPNGAQSVRVYVRRQGLSAGDFLSTLEIRSNDAVEKKTVPIRMVIADNYPPTANAGSDIEVTAGERPTLDGSLSSDPDGDALSFLWTSLGDLVLRDSTSPRPTVESTSVGTYLVSLVVSDGQEQSSPDTMTITVMGKPVLAVSQTGGKSYKYSGTPGKYSLTITFEVFNRGTADATGITMDVRARNSDGGVLLSTRVPVGTVGKGASKVVSARYHGVPLPTIGDVRSASYSLSYNEGETFSGNFSTNR